MAFIEEKDKFLKLRNKVTGKIIDLKKKKVWQPRARPKNLAVKKSNRA